MEKCPRCNTPLEEDTLFCDNCGEKIVLPEDEIKEVTYEVNESKQKLGCFIMIIIVIVFAGLGVWITKLDSAELNEKLGSIFLVIVFFIVNVVLYFINKTTNFKRIKQYTLIPKDQLNTPGGEE